MDGIIVTNIKTNKKQFISYEEIQSQLALGINTNLINIHKNRVQYKIYCSCSSLATMHLKRIGKAPGKIIAATNPNLLQAHHEDCFIRENLKENQLQGIHYRALEIVDEHHIKLSISRLGVFETEKKSKSSTPNKNATISITSSNMTMGSFGRELLARAWEYCMDQHKSKNKPYPSITGIRYALDTLLCGPNALLKVEIKAKEFLQDKLLLGKQKLTSIYHYNMRGIKPILLFPYSKDMMEDYDSYYYILRLPYLHSGKKEETAAGDEDRSVIVLKTEWEAMTKTIHTRVNFENHSQFFIIGLGKSSSYGKPPVLQNFVLIPTTARGMFVDSSYEKELFEEFEKHRRDYIKSNQLVAEFDNLKPDALLRDTAKPCIVEVFGMSESNEKYHLERQKKIQFYKNLHDYQFYYWDAFRNEKPKFLPSKKREKN